ncbi:HTH-type transcriptional regulator YesS [Paenibacillus solanacearum]|uniref:HTH-type transcriptional regulator YesS n=1 Tax=Paenibacillus solanacearum TaxID=2048548 RepID=A0A916NL32_9BACL|nr:helix-turn-helix domain-containing protein [Paenibacillus solanacearum]CAG7648264.1 HTH-type transcriptional regulator YesS [Paenibacillus solanacearum]
MQRRSIPIAPVFYKYLVSYIIVLLIPVGLLGVNGSMQLKEIVNQYVEWTNKEMLNQLGESVDTKILEMNRIAARISSNPDLTPYAVTKDFYSAYLTKPLLDYKVSNDFIQEVLFYIREQPSLYSSVSTYRLPNFINDIYHFPNWPEEQFRHDLNTIAKPTLRPAEDVLFMSSAHERYISYLLPIPTSSLHPYGTVLFLIKESSLLNYLKYEAYPRAGNTIIYDENNRVVTSYKGEGHAEEEALYRALEPTGSMFSVLELNHVKYFVSRLKSDQTGWTYVNVLPVADVMKPINDVVSKWLRTLFFILLLGSFVIYALLRYNYNPIKKLAQLAEMHLGKTIAKSNELDTVRTLIDKIMLSNDELGQKFERNRSAIRQQLLLDLLKGEIETQEQLRERGSEIGVSLEHPVYAVFVVEGAGLTAATMQCVADAITGRSGEALAVYAKESIGNDMMIFLVSTSRTEEELSEWMREWHEAVFRDFGVKLTCGVGQPYRELKQFGRSFIEASTASDYKFIKGSGQIIHFREVASDHTSTLFDTGKEMDHLSFLLREGKTKQIAETLAQFTQHIKQGGTTLFVARCLCFDIIHTVMLTVQELRNEFPQLTGQLPDVMTLMQFHTVEELAELITKACIDVSQAVQELRGHPSERLLESMLDYLHTHCRQPDFSVQAMAGHFALSASYLSRFFKENTGQTISDYVHSIRINNAKKLLEQSDTSIKDIVQLVGYFDTSSFIRKFKTEVGVTPGEYRKMTRQQAGSPPTG